MSNFRDGWNKWLVGLKGKASPDWVKIISSKSGARHIEKDIPTFKKDVKSLVNDIDSGQSNEFKEDYLHAVSVLAHEIHTEKAVAEKNVYFELQEEDSIKHIKEAFNKLLKFVETKKIKSKSVDDSIKELRDLIASVHKFSHSSEKTAWNLDHGHEAMARFLHLRGIHSIANNMKVQEREFRKWRSKANGEEGKVLGLIKNIVQSKSMKDFENLCSDLKKHIHKFAVDSLEEFKDLTEADNMDMLLMVHTKSSTEEIDRVMHRAEEAGYDTEEGQKLVAKAKALHESFEDLAEQMKNWHKAVDNTAADLEK